MSALRRMILTANVSMVALILTGCLAASPRLVKIGFVAPFEGRYREIGVDTIPAARLAIREWAEMHPTTPISIELVAYDDGGDPDQAAAQAQKITADPAVQVVVGHWLTETTEAALPVYRDSALPVIAYSPTELADAGEVYNLSPSLEDMADAAAHWATQETSTSTIIVRDQDVTDAVNALNSAPSGGTVVGGPVWGLQQFYSLSGDSASGVFFVSGTALPADLNGGYWTQDSRQSFIHGFEIGSLSAPPGLLSVIGYEATWLALDLIAAQHGITDTESPVRQYQFGDDGRLQDPGIYLYRWSGGQRLLIETLH